MVELLKQPQYRPMHVIDQVIVIYAGVAASSTRSRVDKVRDWEARLLKYVHENHQAYSDAFAAKRELTKDIEDELRRILAQFNEAYLAGKAAGPALAAMPSSSTPSVFPVGAPPRVESHVRARRPAARVAV